MGEKVKTCRSTDPGDAIAFRCPGCGDMHVVPVKGAGAWTWNGSLETPTLSPSLLARSGHYVPEWQGDECWCTWNVSSGDPAPFTCSVCHSFVMNGRIQFLSDCTHALAGQTVELPDIEQK